MNSVTLISYHTFYSCQIMMILIYMYVEDEYLLNNY